MSVCRLVAELKHFPGWERAVRSDGRLAHRMSKTWAWSPQSCFWMRGMMSSRNEGADLALFFSLLIARTCSKPDRSLSFKTPYSAVSVRRVPVRHFPEHVEGLQRVWPMTLTNSCLIARSTSP